VVAEPVKKTTRHTRLAEDICDMLGWLAEFSGDSVADIADPILRPEVERQYARIRDRVETIKAAKSLPDPDEPVPTHELGEAGA
jgi:hypothetical protein